MQIDDPVIESAREVRSPPVEIAMREDFDQLLSAMKGEIQTLRNEIFKQRKEFNLLHSAIVEMRKFKTILEKEAYDFSTQTRISIDLLKKESKTLVEAKMDAEVSLGELRKIIT